MKFMEVVDSLIDRLIYVFRSNRGSWRKSGYISGATGHYCSPVITDDNLTLYTNNLDLDSNGNLYRYTGSLSSVGQPKLVMERDDIDEYPDGNGYIRTLCIRRDHSTGTLYGIIHVADGYPSNDGSVPAFITSTDDGLTWKYHGKIVIEGQVRPIQSDSGAFILQPQFVELDHKNPSRNRYVLLEYYEAKMCVVYSLDGASWYLYRESGEVRDIWPLDMGLDNPCFVSAEYANGTFHIVCGNQFPVTEHRYLTSIDLINLTLVESNAATLNSYKGTALARDNTGKLHAVTASHFHYTH